MRKRIQLILPLTSYLQWHRTSNEYQQNHVLFQYLMPIYLIPLPRFSTSGPLYGRRSRPSWVRTAGSSMIASSSKNAFTTVAHAPAHVACPPGYAGWSWTTFWERYW